MKINPKKTDKEIERAIIMLVDCVKESCHNPKPVILHSLRVGFKLIELKQSKEAIIAGILHDLVEDTDCTIEKIKKAFGLRIAKLVFAVTQEKEVDYKKRWYILMKKIKRAGKSAMIIKLTDINANLPFILLVKSRKELQTIKWKNNFALTQLKPYVGKLKIFQECKRRYKKTFKKLDIK